MAEKIPMLALSPTMDEGVIVKWNKNEGDSVEQGDVLCEVETDKATMELESPESGTLLKILTPEGEGSPVGETIAIIGEEGEDVSELAKEAEEEAEAEKKEEQKEQPEEKKQEEPEEKEAEEKEVEKEKEKKAPKETAEGQIKSSPLARKLASEHGLDLENIKGTGPEGRITEKDVRKAIKEKPAAVAEVKLKEKRIELTNKQKVIAERMTSSNTSVPHFYLKSSIAVDNIIEARRKINKKRDEKVSLNAFVIKLVAEALKKNPLINSSLEDDTVIQHGTIDIGLSVSQEKGLITPVIRNCQNKSILQIDSELKDLVPKARESKLSKEQYSNSTFTISTLGSMGIDEYTAIINPPNSAILSVGAIRKIQTFDEQNTPRIQNIITFTLSCDHRVIYGAEGAEFLGDLRDIIENPINAFL